MFGVCVSIANKQDVSVYFSYLPLLLLLLPDMYLFLSVMMMTFYGKNGFANSICFIQNTNTFLILSKRYIFGIQQTWWWWWNNSWDIDWKLAKKKTNKQITMENAGRIHTVCILIQVLSFSSLSLFSPTNNNEDVPRLKIATVPYHKTLNKTIAPKYNWIFFFFWMRKMWMGKKFSHVFVVVVVGWWSSS